MKLTEVKGIGAGYEKLLKGAGISTVEQLLKAGDTPKKRKALSAKISLESSIILRWLNRADLHRVNGIGQQLGDLLELSGVDTIPELAQRKPANLLAKMKEASEEYNLKRKLPTEKQVKDWVAQAKKLPRVLKY